jgi:hypothetical protein
VRRNLTWKARLYQGMLVRCQCYHGDDVCSLGKVTMSHDDEMDSYT